MLEVPAVWRSVDEGGEFTAEEKAVIELRKKYHQITEEPNPAIMVLDADGVPYAELSSEEQPPDVYIPEFKEALARRVARDADFKAARRESGIKKARLLHKGLLRLVESRSEYGLDDLIADYYQNVLTEIIRNDPQDTLGWAKAWQEERRFNADMLQVKTTNDRLDNLAAQLDQMIDNGASIRAVFSRIDGFMRDQSDFPAWGRQRALTGKVEAALILHDYTSALGALNDLESAFPNDSKDYKTLGSTVRAELNKARELSESGVDRGVSDFAIRFNFDAVASFDADGVRTRRELKKLEEENGAAMLNESHMGLILGMVGRLIRLGEYEQALTGLDRFVEIGGPPSEMAKRYDRSYRSIIMRKQGRKQPGSGQQPKPEHTNSDQTAPGSEWKSEDRGKLQDKPGKLLR